MGLAAAGSDPAEDGGFLWVVKIRSAHFHRTGSKAVGQISRPMFLIRDSLASLTDGSRY
jgi:hypothetical protein